MASSTVRLSGGGLELLIHPEHGFTIGQIIDTATGTPLLWRRDVPADACPADLGLAGTASIDTFDGDLLIGGWFVMFPTAGLPGSASDRWMHGEAARLPWTVTTQSERTVTCTVRTPASGFRITRTVQVDDGGLTVETAAVNESGVPQQVSYGEHPCLSRSSFAGGRLDVPARAAAVLPAAQSEAAVLTEGPVADWPVVETRTGGALDLGTVPTEADGGHDHVSVELAGPTVSIEAPSIGRRLELTVDLSELGHLLLWRHAAPPNRPWMADVLAPEPSSAPGRDWDDAVAAEAVRVVRPGETVRFGVRMRWVPSAGA